MAKSPFSQRLKKDFSSGRLKRVGNFSQITLKNKCFQLPVCRSGSSFHNARNKAMNFPIRGKHFPNNKKFCSKEVTFQKMKLVQKYFNSKNEILKSFENKDLSKEMLKNSVKPKIKNKLKKLKIGIFEREFAEYPQNKKIQINQNKNKNESNLKNHGLTIKNRKISNNKLIENFDSNNDTKQKLKKINKNKFIKNSLNLDTSPSKITKNKDLQNPKIKNSLKTETPKNKIASFPLGNSILIPKPSFKKDTDNITVTTCNTQNEKGFSCKIIEELPNRKFREVELSEIQKHFLTYSGT